MWPQGRPPPKAGSAFSRIPGPLFHTKGMVFISSLALCDVLLDHAFLENAVGFNGSIDLEAAFVLS